MPTYRKKLIEVNIPLQAINVESAKDASLTHGHPSTLQRYWARRDAKGTGKDETILLQRVSYLHFLRLQAAGRNFTIADRTERCICVMAQNRHRRLKRMPLCRRIHNLCPAAVAAALLKRTERRTPLTTSDVQTDHPIFSRIHRRCRGNSIPRN